MTATAVELEKLSMPGWDFTDSEIAADPFTAARTLLAEGHWIARAPNGYILLRWEDCDRISRDSRFRTPPALGLAAQGITDGIGFEWASRTVPGVDEDDHKRIRRLANPAFARGSLENMRPYARNLLEQIFAPLASNDRAEVSELSLSYSVRMICHLLHWPDEDWQRINDWADAANQLINPAITAETLRWVEQNLVGLRQYTTANLERMKGREGDDLGSAIMASAEEADTLSQEEMVSLFESLLVAGADTTRAALSNALYLFARHPQQWQDLLLDQSLVPSAVNEILRYRPVTFATAREAKQDLEYRDTSIPSGTFLLLAHAAANFDSNAFADPDSFDIHRYDDGRKTPRPPHLTFGYGMHVCLGQHLARLELQEALKFLAPRLINLRIDDTDPRGVEWKPMTGVHGPDWLPLAWDPASE